MDIINLFLYNLAIEIAWQILIFSLFAIATAMLYAIALKLSKNIIIRASKMYKDFKNRNYTAEELLAVDNEFCEIFDHVDYHDQNIIIETKEHDSYQKEFTWHGHDDNEESWELEFGSSIDHDWNDKTDHSEFGYDTNHHAYCTTNENTHTHNI